LARFSLCFTLSLEILDEILRLILRRQPYYVILNLKGKHEYRFCLTKAECHWYKLITTK
jgi:hypothetical protein